MNSKRLAFLEEMDIDLTTKPHAAYVFKNGSEVSSWTDVLNKTPGSSNVFEIYQWSEGKYCLN